MKSIKKFIIYIIIGIACIGIGVGLTLLFINKNANNKSSKVSKNNITTENVDKKDDELEGLDSKKKMEQSDINQSESLDLRKKQEETTENESPKTSNNTSTKSNSSNNNQNTTSKNNVQSKTIISATISYYCLTGYTLNGKKCTSTTSYDAGVKYSCTSGTLKGQNCVSPVDIYVNYTLASIEYCTAKGFAGSGYFNTCKCTQSGGEFLKNGDCYKSGYKTVPASVEYYCSDSFELIGTKCVASSTIDAFYKYECPDGYKLNGTQCEKL